MTGVNTTKASAQHGENILILRLSKSTGRFMVRLLPLRLPYGELAVRDYSIVLASEAVSKPPTVGPLEVAEPLNFFFAEWCE